ncbi:MAG: DUF4199 domain-containing protein [Bacteroidota bacterium]|jgi:hypothetical protein
MSSPVQGKLPHLLQYALAAVVSAIILGLAIYMLELQDWFSYFTYAFYITFLVLALRSWGERRGVLGMSYGQAFGYATQMALIYSVIIAIWSVVFVKVIAPGYVEAQQEIQYDKMRDQGMAESQIEMAAEWGQKFSTTPMILLFALFGNMFMLTLVNLVVCAFMKKNAAGSPLGPHNFPPKSSDYSPLQ